MSDITWHKGDSIPYGSKGQRDRFVYVMTEDDSGWPSVTICHVYGKFSDVSPEDKRWHTIAKSLEVNRDPERFMRSYTPPLVPWIRIGNSGTESKLSSCWEIVAWAECELPEIPDYTKFVE